MLEDIGKLKVFVCASKLYGFTLRGYDSHAEDDMTRFKRGIRANSELNWQEVWFRVLSTAGVLSVFKKKAALVGSVKLVANDFTDMAAYCRDRAKDSNQRGDSCLASGASESAQHYYDNAEFYLTQAEMYDILAPLHADAKAMFDKIVPKKKNIKWEDLTCIQMYKYNSVENKFVPIETE